MNASAVIIVAFLTSAVTAGGTVYVIERMTDSTVPDLRGATEIDARHNAEAAHIGLMIASREATADTKPGTVIRQSVPAGLRVAHDYSMSVVLADEVAEVELPKMVGVSVNQAKTDLEKLGMKPVIRWVAMAETPTFVVLQQEPAAGGKAKLGTEVQLTANR